MKSFFFPKVASFVAQGLASACMVVGMALPVSAQQFPASPIKFIVPYDAGGANDIAARRFQKIAASQGVQIVVENLPGASGTIGLNRVGRSAPDGYTIGMGTSTTLSNMALGIGSLRRSEYMPITQLSVDPLLLVVPAKSSIHSISDFLSAAQKAQGGLTMGSPGINNMNHIFGVLAGKAAEADVTIVPYPGGAKVQVDLAGGHLDAAVVKPSESKANIAAGLVRPIAVFSDKRISMLPNTPTFKEQGHDVFPYGPLVQMSYIVVPKGVPDEVRARLIQISQAVVRTAEYQSFLADSGLTVEDESGASLAQLEEQVSNSLQRVAERVLNNPAKSKR